MTEEKFSERFGTLRPEIDYKFSKWPDDPLAKSASLKDSMERPIKKLADSEIKRVKTAPVAVEKVEEAETECSICLNEKLEVVLPCTHAFCSDCIADWITRDKECPMCRDDLNSRLNELQKHLSHELTPSEANERCQASFFELVDIQGKDDVMGDMESRTRYLLRNALDYMLKLPSYNMEAAHTVENPHIKVDLDYYA